MVEQIAEYFGRLSRLRCFLLSLTLVVAIAVADYTSGYELRLSVLYLIPIGLTTWVINLPAGVGTATLASALWLLSFQKGHFYREQVFYLWEAVIMLCSFMVVAWLSARLRRALIQADERFFRVVEEVQSAIYVRDETHGVIAYANPVMRSLAGNAGVADAKLFEKRFVTARETTAGDFTVKDAETGRWYWRQSFPIPWGKDQTMKLVVLTDITEQKHAERLKEKHLEGMHHAAQLTTLAETASTLAHEINQPLMVIATYTDACQRMIESREMDMAEVSQILKKCHAQAVRASAIIERLREFIRQRQPNPVACNTKDLLEAALEATRPQLEEAHVQVKIVNPVPAMIIQADRTLLAQALANLMRNAAESMDAVPVDQRLLLIEVTDQDAEALRISIADHGCGLDPDLIDAMFSPFVTTKADGLGLGLSICKSIVEAHGGRLWAENNAQAGATFHLALPKAP